MAAASESAESSFFSFFFSSFFSSFFTAFTSSFLASLFAPALRSPHLDSFFFSSFFSSFFSALTSSFFFSSFFSSFFSALTSSFFFSSFFSSFFSALTSFFSSFFSSLGFDPFSRTSTRPRYSPVIWIVLPPEYTCTTRLKSRRNSLFHCPVRMRRVIILYSTWPPEVSSVSPFHTSPSDQRRGMASSTFHAPNSLAPPTTAISWPKGMRLWMLKATVTFFLASFLVMLRDPSNRPEIVRSAPPS